MSVALCQDICIQKIIHGAHGVSFSSVKVAVVSITFLIDVRSDLRGKESFWLIVSVLHSKEVMAELMFSGAHARGSSCVGESGNRKLKMK